MFLLNPFVAFGEDAPVDLTTMLAQGSYSFTGQSIGASVSSVATLAQGTYAVTGESVGATLALEALLGQGSYAVTGESIDATATGTAALGQGSYTLTGEAINAPVAFIAGLEQGSYTVTGESINATVVNPVSFVAASTETITSGATTLAVTVPSGAAVGDLALACIMHRSAINSVPSGWTLVDSTSGVGSSTTQFTSVYKRVLTSGEPGSSITFGQTSSGRMIEQVLTFHKSGGCDVVDHDTATSSNITTNSNIGSMAVSTATADSQMGVMVASTIGAAAGTGTISASVGTLDSPASATDNRLAVAHLARNSGQTTAGTFTSNGSSNTSNGWPAVSAVVG